MTVVNSLSLRFFESLGMTYKLRKPRRRIECINFWDDVLVVEFFASYGIN